MRTPLFLIALVLTVFIETALADEVFLSDGSRLIGTIEQVRDGELVIETEFAGKLTVDMEGVEGMRTDDVLGIGFENGEPLFGTLNFDSSEQSIVTDDDEPHPIDLEEVTVVWPKDEEMPRVDRIWSGRVEIGLDGARGNSDSFNFLGLSTAIRETEGNKLVLDAKGHFEEDSGLRSENEFKASGRYEWKFRGEWNAFVRGELETDEFEKVNLRSSMIVGMGKKFLETERHEYAARVGIGFLREDFKSAEMVTDSIFVFGYDYALKIRESFKLTHDLNLYSTLDEPTNGFRVVVNTAGELSLTNDEHWKLRGGLMHEFDEEPLPDVDGLDVTYYINLGYDW